MNSFKKYLISSACLLVWPSAAHAEEPAKVESGVASADPQPSSKQLWDWYGEASDLHDAGKLSEAWAIYQRVWRYRKTYDVATSLGGVCFQRNEYALAAHYYRIALDEMVPTASPTLVKEVEDTFEKARAQATLLRVEVAPSDGKAVVPFTITDDSANVDVEAPYYLEPGERELSARTPGREPISLHVLAKPGTTVDWKIDFGAETSPPGDMPRLGTVRHPWIVFPIGGLLTAGLAYGAWRNAERGSNAYDAAVNLDLRQYDCTRSGGGPACERAVTLRQQARDAETRAWLFGGGALLAAASTGLVYWLWETEVPVTVGFDPMSGAGEMRWKYAF